MPDDVMTDVAPDSSTGTPEPQSPAPGQAPSAPVADAQPQRTVPLDTHIRERSAWQREKQEYQRRLAESDRRFTEQPKPSAAQPLSIEEQINRREAMTQLKALIGDDDELKALLDLAKQAPKVLQASQGVSQLQEHQARANTTRGFQHIASLAKAEGLPTDPKFINRLSRMVALEARDLPDADARFIDGDYSVLTEAFNALKGEFFGQARREAAANLVATRSAANQIPTPTRNGGPPGAAAPPKLTAENGREVRDGLRQRFMDKLMGGAQE